MLRLSISTSLNGKEVNLLAEKICATTVASLSLAKAEKILHYARKVFYGGYEEYQIFRGLMPMFPFALKDDKVQWEGTVSQSNEKIKVLS